LSRKRWASTHITPAKEIGQEDTYLYGAGTTTVASPLGHGARGGRARQIIYQKSMRMESDPIVSSALQLLVTSALGGHETSGDLVFVEKTAEAKKDKRLAAIADENLWTAHRASCGCFSCRPMRPNFRQPECWYIKT